MLTQSLRSGQEHKPISASKFYGIWGDDGMSTEEFVQLLEKERSFHQNIVEL